MTKEGAILATDSPNRTIANLNEILRSVLHSRESDHSAAGIKLSIDFVNNLPQVSVDPCQIEHVLLKLVLNAEKAIGVDLDRPGQIQVKTSVESQRIQVTVTDNGRGIHSRDMAGLFGDQGMDPALCICAEIVKDHGGDLYAWSSYRNGSVFTLELPIHGDIEQQIQPPQTAERTSEPQGLNGKRILIIDDEVQVASLMFDVLGREGANVDLANCGLQAVDQVKSKQYDLLVCDQQLPDLTGERLYRWIGVINPELRQRVLFVTGEVLTGATEDFFTRAGVQYVQKPFRTVEFVQAVEQVLSRSPQPGF